MDEKLLTFKDILDILKKRITLIVSLCLLFCIISLSISTFLIKPKYSTSAKLLVGSATDNIEQYNLSGKLIKTYAELIKSDDLINKSIKDSNVNMALQEVKSNLTITADAESQVLELNFVTNNSEDGINFINKLVENFIEQYSSLNSSGSVTILNYPNKPSVPFYPNKVNSAILGIFLGFALAIVICMILHALDNSIKSDEDMEQILKAPSLGTVHKFDGKNNFIK